MFRFRIFWFLILCVLFLTCCSTGVAAGISGRWSGSANQSGPGDYQTSFTIDMTLQGESGSIDYPSLSCGGTLTFENQRDTFTFYRESITYGRDTCIDGGLIAVEPNGNSLQWAWNAPGSTASGVLMGTRSLQSCSECSAARDRCFAGCDNEPTLPEQSNCVNICNQEYSCTIGYDCN